MNIYDKEKKTNRTEIWVFGSRFEPNREFFSVRGSRFEPSHPYNLHTPSSVTTRSSISGYCLDTAGILPSDLVIRFCHLTQYTFDDVKSLSMGPHMRPSFRPRECGLNRNRRSTNVNFWKSTCCKNIFYNR